MTEPLPDYITQADQRHTISRPARQVYNYICQHKAAHDGNSPTLREITVGSGLAPTSTATAAGHLRRLERAGLIRRSRGGARGIEVVGGKWTPPDGETVEVTSAHPPLARSAPYRVGIAIDEVLARVAQLRQENGAGVGG